MPGPLSEQEFNAVLDRVAQAAPKGLSEAQFNALLDAEVARAEGVGPQGSATSRFLSNAGEMLNPVAAVTGLVGAVAHPVQTTKNIYGASSAEFDKAVDAYQQGRPSEMLGHGAAAFLPVLGPAAAATGEQIASGDVAGGLGSGAGLVTGAVLAGPLARTAGKAMRPAAAAVAQRLYQSALKPTKAVLKGVRAVSGPDAAREALIQTGLNEEIPVSARGVQKVGNLIDSLNTEVEMRLKAATARGETVDPARVEKLIADVAADFTDQINAQPDLSAIEAVRQNFATNPNTSRVVQGPAGRATLPADIPVATAQRMKVNTYKGLRGKYGVERGATIEAEKAGARGLKEGIEQAAPEVAGLNAREGQLIPLEEALADAMRRRGNYGIFGLTPVVASVPAVAHGNFLPLLAAMTDRAPGVISRTGIWINRVGKRSGRFAHAAGKATVAANATSPSESRSRTTAPGALAPMWAR